MFQVFLIKPLNIIARVSHGVDSKDFVILAGVVLIESQCDKQTHRQTDRHLCHS